LQTSAGVSRVFAPVDTLERALTYHRERHDVLAGNVAHLSVPGYRPVDLARSPAPGAFEMRRTDPRHLAAAGGNETTRLFDDGGNQAGPDGNAVVLEREMAKLDANRLRYGGSAELVTRRLALLRYAAGDGNG